MFELFCCFHCLVFHLCSLCVFPVYLHILLVLSLASQFLHLFPSLSLLLNLFLLCLFITFLSQHSCVSLLSLSAPSNVAVVMNLWFEPVVTGLGLSSCAPVLFFTEQALLGLKVAAAERSFHSLHAPMMENRAEEPLGRTTHKHRD